MKAVNAWITGLVVVNVVLSILIYIAISENAQQRRQNDQLCDAVFFLAQSQGATDQMGFISGKEYCLFFADYSKRRALIGEFDGKIHYDKTPRLIIIHNADEANMAYWDSQPLLYSRYKKIPD